MFCKLCHYGNEVTIKSIFYAIFHSHLSYISIARGRNLHKTVMRIISFAHYDALTLPIFAKLNINKFSDLIQLCIDYSSINILLASLLQFFHMFSF